MMGYFGDWPDELLQRGLPPLPEEPTPPDDGWEEEFAERVVNGILDLPEDYCFDEEMW